MSDVTDLLAAIERGDPQAADDLLPVVYGEPRPLARSFMRAERPEHTSRLRSIGGHRGGLGGPRGHESGQPEYAQSLSARHICCRSVGR